MKHHPSKDFLKEVLADEALDSLRENSLADGMAVLRQRRQARATRRALLTALPMLALAAVLLRPWQKNSPVAVPVAVVTAPAASVVKFYPPTAANDAPAVAAISDEELLNLLKNQPVGLVGPAGHRQLVVFHPAEIAAE